MKKGDIFESLTFTGEEFSDFNDSGKKRYWIYVQCNCGERFSIAKYNWKKQKGCSACAKVERTKVTPLKIGTRFGKLSATGKTKAEFHDHLKVPRTIKYHELECDCGDIKFYRENQLKETQSCKRCAEKETGVKLKTHGKTNTIEYRIFNSAKARAKKRSLDFNIELDDIIIPDYCPVFNIKIDKRLFKNSNRRPLDNSPALDRIDSSRGYLKGNIAVISYIANSIKNEGNAYEHDAIANFMENYEG